MGIVWIGAKHVLFGVRQSVALRIDILHLDAPEQFVILRKREVIFYHGTAADERLIRDGEPFDQIGRVEQRVLFAGNCWPSDGDSLGG